MSNVQVQSEKRKLEQEVIGLNERSRQQDEDNERLKSEISFLRWWWSRWWLVVRVKTRPPY